MDEELDFLLKRIREEGVDQAEAESHDILAKAREQADTILREAEEKAAARLTEAETQAAEYSDRSRRTLEQAGRNLLMSIGDGVHDILTDLVQNAVDEALDIGTLRELITRAVDAYIEQGGRENRLQVLLSEKDRERLLQFFQDRYQGAVNHDIELAVDNDLYGGFRISYGDDRVFHDFSKEAIASALANYLRPHLSEIVERAAMQTGNGGAE